MAGRLDSARDFRLLTVVNALFFAGFGVSAPLDSLYLEELGADYATIALVLASSVGVTLIAGYGWGRLSDRLEHRKSLLASGLLILAAAYGWLSQAQSVAVAWAARLLAGLGFAAFIALSLAMVGDLMEDAPGKGGTMGWFRGLGSLAFALGAVGGGRIADHASLATSMGVCALVFGAGGLVALPLRDHLRNAQPLTHATAEGALTEAAGRELPRTFLLGVMLWMAAHAASTSVWPNYMATFGYSNSAISSLWGLAALIETPSMVIAGMLSDQVGRVAVLASGGLAIAGVQIGYLLAAQLLPALLAVQVLRGYGFGSYTVAAMTFAAEHGPAARRGGASGLFNSAGGAGQILGMYLGGTLAQTWGFERMYGICALLALSSAICFLSLYQRNPQARKHYEQTH